MKGPVKDNAHIRADYAAFMESYGRARIELCRIPGVLGVGFGHVQTSGEFKVALGFQAFVREKRDAASLPAAERVPRTFEGYRVDVRVAQVLAAHSIEGTLDYTSGVDQREPVIMGGIQIEPRKKSLPATGPCMAAGTLGCIVKKRRAGPGDDNVYLLTNAHVLEAEGCDTGDYVYHPYASKTTDPNPGTRLGGIEYGRDSDPNGFPFIDCGLARIDIGSNCFESICGPKKLRYSTTIKGLGPDTIPAPDYKDWITDVRNVSNDPTIMVPVDRNARDEPTTDDAALRTALATATAAHKVRKVGRSTGRTVGIVIGVNVLGVGHIGGRGPEVVLRDLIEIVLDPNFDGGLTVPRGFNRQGNRSFTEEGDSGSIVVDNQNRAIGIIFGGPLARVAGNDFKLSWACHIVPVLDKLGVYIPTKGGTSRGSDGATDGSGQALYSPGDVLPAVPGKVLFASASAEAATTPPQVAPNAQLRAAGERFRASATGAKLFAAFDDHQREITYLVRYSRPAKAAWHRLHGPAFLSQALSHLRGEADRMPKEIRGVQRATLLARLRTVLMTDGSCLLQRALELHGDTLLALGDAETLDECLAILRRLDAAEVTA